MCVATVEMLAFADLFSNVPLAIWVILTCLIGLGWLRRHRDIQRAKHEPALTAAGLSLAGRNWPSLSVLVAAKDESANIGQCLSGLLSQQYPDAQFIAINDRSADDTGRIMEEIVAADPRLSAVHVRHLPEGWFGKNHAMHTGVAQARGEWLAFTDADCTFESPMLLAAAVQHARSENLDFLSVLPRLEAREFWERVVQPVAGGILLIWFPWKRVNDPRKRTAYANGAFMLLRRDAYDKLGGHYPVRATLNEDMHLARLAKTIGLRLKVIRGDTLYRVRMYEGLGQIWRGWSRIFYGCFGTFPRLLGSIVLLSLFSISPYLTLALSFLAGDLWRWPAAAGAFTILAQQSVLSRYYRLLGHSPWLALTYPMGAAICLGMILNAMRRLSGSVTTTWRGTAYRGGGQPTAAPASPPETPPPKATPEIANERG